jgi:hypothetical protein
MTKRVVDERLLAALAGGQTVAEAAGAAGVSVRTAYRRIRRQEFQVQLSEARHEILQTALGRLLNASEEAVAALRSLIENGPPTVRLAAARAVLELGPRYREHLEFDSRLSRVERSTRDEVAG